MCETLAVRKPFDGDTAVAVAYQQVRQDPAPPSRYDDRIPPDLDAVILKALAKNPDNRYQTAAEMRTDLLRVRDGQAPHAPKILTHGDRDDLSAATLAGQPHGLRAPRLRPEKRGWLIAAAAAAVIVGVAILAVLITSRNPAVRVSDLHGQTQQEAIAALQGLGLKINGPHEDPDPTLRVGRVITTEPGPGAALGAGQEVTINVSAGPAQHTVPNCTNLTFDTCVRRLADVGFGHPKPLATPSATTASQLVIATMPAAGQSAVTTGDVLVQISTRPGTRRVPDVAGQPTQQATDNLKAAGFATILTGPIDSVLPAGQVVSTDPPAGTQLPVDSAVTL